MAKKESWVRIGLKCAKKSTHTFKVSAMIVRGGKILAVAYNSDKTDPIFAKRPDLNRGLPESKIVAKLHAEQRVLDMVSPELLKGADMVVIRASSKKTLGISRPCRLCQREIKKAGIRKVFYTLDYGEMVCERF